MTTNSKTADKFVVRLPSGLRDHLKDRAEKDLRSMNDTFVDALSRYLLQQERFDRMLDSFDNRADIKADEDD